MSLIWKTSRMSDCSLQNALIDNNADQLTRCRPIPLPETQQSLLHKNAIENRVGGNTRIWQSNRQISAFLSYRQNIPITTSTPHAAQPKMVGRPKAKGL